MTSRRIALYSPDRAIVYDGRTPDEIGVGGGITARLSLVGALAALGHTVTAYVNCRERIEHAGVRYVPLDEIECTGATGIDADLLIAISTGGALSFAPLRRVAVRATRRIVWIQGVPKPADLDAVDADRFVVASRFLRDVLVERWGIPVDRIFPCYNGLHQERFREIEQHPPARDPYALAYIGPPEKGLASAIDVLRRLRRHDARYHLDVFGGARLWGRDTTGTEDDTSSEPGVRSMGLVGQAALIPRLFEYEFCLAPQAMEEGFGIAVQEARRAGQIVLASRVGALAELIRDGYDGFLIDASHTTPASHDRMAEIVLGLAGDEERRARLRRRAIVAASTFSWMEAAGAWTEILASHEGGAGLRACRFLIAGYYGHGNLGDEAILGATLAELRRQMPSVQVTVASGNPSDTRLRHRVDAVHERDVPALTTAASQSDAVVLGGGGLFHDHFGVDDRTMLSRQQWGLTQLAAFPAIAAACEKPFVILGVGVGPLTTEEGRRLTRLMFERASLATVRDESSRELLAELGIARDRLDVTADPAFLVQLVPEGTPTNQRIAVALRSWDRDTDSATWQRAIADALDRVISRTGMTVVFVPFQVSTVGQGFGPAMIGTPEGLPNHLNDDRTAADAVRSLMSHRDATSIADDDLSAAEVVSLFASSRLVLAMRLHGAILSAAAGTPGVALAYDPKVCSVMRQLGRENFVVDLNAISADVLEARITAALESTPAPLNACVRDRARRNVSALVDLLRSNAMTLPAASPEWNALMFTTLQERTRELNVLKSQVGEAPGTAVPGTDRPIRRAIKRFMLVPARRMLRAASRYLMSRPAYVFDRYKCARAAMYGDDLAGVRAPGEPGLVSIVLPVYNGAGMVLASIDSVLAQTYSNLELIVVDDGSTDGTIEIVRDAAARDSRIRLIEQEHAQLPAALNRGFSVARGEFLTWTSADNRMKPACIEKLVDALRRHPAWDVTYANIDVIDERGEFWRDSAHYERYQRPHGSEHVHLPASTSELNVIANNSVGAAFLYRSRVPALIGDYSRQRFVMEDYDYWMRANAMMTVRHADFTEPVYDYRFHRNSLTSRWEQFDMLGHRDRMMVFDDFRRDFFLQPIVWVIDGLPEPLASELRSRIRAAGHLLYSGEYVLTDLPHLSVPVVCVGATPITRIGVLNVLLTKSDTLTADVDAEWDLCIAVGSHPFAPRLSKARQGWLLAADMATAFHAIDIRAKSDHLVRIEATIEQPQLSPATCKASIVICTRSASDRLIRVLAAAAGQQTRHAFEIIVVDNSGGDRIRHAVPSTVRVVLCPIAGLSAARNAGLAEARGEIVCFVDDDAVPEREWLDWICRAFDEHPEAGVVGGQIKLHVPEQHARAVPAGWRKYWSEFLPPYDRYTEVAQWARYPWGANWSARRDLLRAVGGFRTQYGRTGNNYWGGEEMVAAALIQRLGARVAVEPRAVVVHDVNPSRFTLSHVARTIIAGHQVYHRAQNDLYVPRQDFIATLAQQIRRSQRDRSALPVERRWLDIALRKYAQAGVLIAQLSDIHRRLRKPVVDS